jgi:hypothetical protein
MAVLATGQAAVSGLGADRVTSIAERAISRLACRYSARLWLTVDTWEAWRLILPLAVS